MKGSSYWGRIIDPHQSVLVNILVMSLARVTKQIFAFGSETFTKFTM